MFIVSVDCWDYQDHVLFSLSFVPLWSSMSTLIETIHAMWNPHIISFYMIPRGGGERAFPEKCHRPIHWKSLLLIRFSFFPLLKLQWFNWTTLRKITILIFYNWIYLWPLGISGPGWNGVGESILVSSLPGPS